jgi:hypothetical protein
MSCRIWTVGVGAVALGAICLVLSGCGRSGPRSAAHSGGGSLGTDDLVIGEGITEGNLTIFPVTTKKLRSEDRFITLDEGLKEGVIEVQELNATPAADSSGAQPETTSQPGSAAQQPAANATANAPVNGDLVQDGASAQTTGASAQVNQLAVINRSERPLYLMPGEIVVGGQQDRAVGQEYIIEAKTGPVPIDVFCIEHGRWETKGRAALSLVIDQTHAVAGLADSVAVSPVASTPEKAVEVSKNGGFVATVGNLGKHGRMAVQDKANQSEVWNEVAQENALSGAADGNATGAFTENYAGKKVVDKLEPLVEKLKEPIAKTPNIVGVIIAINGKVDSMDVFQSTPLFQKLWPKLLKSYAFDATNAASDEKSAAACTVDEAKEFMKTAVSGKAEAKQGENGTVTARRGDETVCFSLHDRQPMAADANGGGFGMGGGVGGGMAGEAADDLSAAVHTSGFKK